MARQTIPAEVERRVRIAANNRCGYCLSPQHLVMARLEIEHILPLARGGTDGEENLWLACPLCNGHKSDKIATFDHDVAQKSPCLIHAYKHGRSIFNEMMMVSISVARHLLAAQRF